MADGVKLTVAQSAVLRWLWHYPGIHIVWIGPLETSVTWSASWASEEARQHMVEMMGKSAEYIMVGEGNYSAGFQQGAIQYATPRGESLAEATPKLRFGTFKALLCRGLIEMTAYREAAGVWAGTRYYQLSARGAAVTPQEEA